MLSWYHKFNLRKNQIPVINPKETVMKKIQILAIWCATFLLWFGAAPALAEEGDSLWSQTYGGTAGELAYKVIQTSDGGYLLAGMTSSFGAGNIDGWLVKTDSIGDSLWSHPFGGINEDRFSSVIQTSDGGYALAGFTQSFGASGYDMWLVKTNAIGDVLWSRRYGGSNDDWATSVIPTNDGGYLLAGYTLSFGAGGEDMWLVKTNANGDSLWSRRYGGSNDDRASEVIQTEDGNYLLAGMTASFGAGNWDMWLVKIHTNGDSLWSRTYGGPNDDWANAVIETSDGDYVAVGVTYSFGAGNRDMWLVKTHSNGDTLWTRPYGGIGDEWGSSVIETSDGCYLPFGWTTTFGAGSYDMWLVKTTSTGDSLWSKTYGGSGYEWGNSVIQNSDGDYLLAGWTTTYGPSADYDMWLVCVAGPVLKITLTPYNPPIVIPDSGGYFDYLIELENATQSVQTFDVWCNIEIPSGSQFTILGPVQVTMNPNYTIVRLRRQWVPAGAPGGQYIVKGFIGDHPWMVIDTSSFTFTKQGNASEWKGVEDWINTGESLSEEVDKTLVTPRSTLNSSPSPNPFNPITRISYELQAASLVSLQVYDTTGRLVATLVDKLQSAGAHQVAFDGSSLPSGIYLYRIIAGQNTASGKMLLLK
jgi:hypothetical protein